MTANEIAALRALMAKSTPGEWAWFTGEYADERAMVMTKDRRRQIIGIYGLKEGTSQSLADDEVLANASLIAAAVNALPALLAAAEDAARMRAALGHIAETLTSDAVSVTGLTGDFKSGIVAVARAALAGKPTP